jgi:hypothetical protein
MATKERPTREIVRAAVADRIPPQAIDAGPSSTFSPRKRPSIWSR